MTAWLDNLLARFQRLRCVVADCPERAPRRAWMGLCVQHDIEANTRGIG